MSFLQNICGSILESAMVTSIIDTDESDNSITNSTEDWSYLFMPDPIAGGSENVETIYNN